VLEFIQDLFKFEPKVKVCQTCEAHVKSINLLQYHISDLKDEIVQLRAENAMLHEKLFQAVRLNAPLLSANQGIRANDLQGQTTNLPVKSWPRLKQELERAHLKKPDDAKLKYWQGINEKAGSVLLDKQGRLFADQEAEDIKELEKDFNASQISETI
jgi:hypothetical protein